MYFLAISSLNFHIFSLGKGQDPSFDQSYIPFNQGCFNCVMFGWNWPSGSKEEDENVKSLQTDGVDG